MTNKQQGLQYQTDRSGEIEGKIKRVGYFL